MPTPFAANLFQKIADPYRPHPNEARHFTLRAVKNASGMEEPFNMWNDRPLGMVPQRSRRLDTLVFSATEVTAD